MKLAYCIYVQFYVAPDRETVDMCRSTWFQSSKRDRSFDGLRNPVPDSAGEVEALYCLLHDVVGRGVPEAKARDLRMEAALRLVLEHLESTESVAVIRPP